jgi:hypothetical protein
MMMIINSIGDEKMNFGSRCYCDSERIDWTNKVAEDEPMDALFLQQNTGDHADRFLKPSPSHLDPNFY